MKNECDHSLLRLISVTGLMIRSRADQWLKKYDLTIEQLQVLKELAREQGKTQRSLCIATGKSPANITRILDRLEKKKRIVRRRNPDDRRSSLVFLTENGEKIRNEVQQKLQVLSENLLAGIESNRQHIAYDVLLQVAENIENIS